MAQMPIAVVPYDPTWPARFARECKALQTQLGPWLTAQPEHVGSTAVEGLCAKPILDIMAPVASLEASREAIQAAQALDYVYYPYKPEVMHWFCKPSPAHRTHHLHLIPYQSPLWHQRLAFRDALRADRGLARRYEALKHTLAAQHRHDREAYTQGKTPFVMEVLGLL